MKKYNENILAALELVLGNIYEVARNKWVSVKDFSIAKMLIDAGLHKNYAPPLVDVLKRHGIIESEGVRTGMRYKVVTDVIPDLEAVAIEVKDAFDRKIADYISRRSSDNQPFKPTKTPGIDDDFVGKVTKGKEKKMRKINLPNLLDIRYIVRDGFIHECMVMSCKYEEETKSYLYSLRFRDEDGILANKENVLLSNLYETPEEIVKNLLKNIVKL